MAASIPAIDAHTHLFPPAFGPLWRSGIDYLLTRDDLVAELFRLGLQPGEYWSRDRQQRATLVWQVLFVRGGAQAAACRDALEVMDAFGLEELERAREYFRGQDPQAHTRRVLELAGVRAVVMSNDPLSAREDRLWRETGAVPPEFLPALRVDAILGKWPASHARLNALGYETEADVDAATCDEVRRFLHNRVVRIQPLCLVSAFPAEWLALPHSVRLLKEAVLPCCREHGLPLMLMIGGCGRTARRAGVDVEALERLCREHLDERFVATAPTAGAQRQLCAAASRCGNLLPLAEPSAELTSGYAAAPSDAAVLEELIPAWRQLRRSLNKALPGAAREFAILWGNFARFLGLPGGEAASGAAG